MAFVLMDGAQGHSPSRRESTRGNREGRRSDRCGGGGFGGVLSGQEMDVAGPSLPSTTRGRMMGLESCRPRRLVVVPSISATLNQ